MYEYENKLSFADDFCCCVKYNRVNQIKSKSLTEQINKTRLLS